jgi:hypothetical protein
MNDVRIDWRKILMGFAWQFVCIVKKETVESSGAVRCFVVDDTLMEKAGKTFSGISKVYDHAKQAFVYGFKMLLPNLSMLKLKRSEPP